MASTHTKQRGDGESRKSWTSSTYRKLPLRLENPFGTPPLIPVPVQFSLELI